MHLSRFSSVMDKKGNDFFVIFSSFALRFHVEHRTMQYSYNLRIESTK